MGQRLWFINLGAHSDWHTAGTSLMFAGQVIGQADLRAVDRRTELLRVLLGWGGNGQSDSRAAPSSLPCLALSPGLSESSLHPPRSPGPHLASHTIPGDTTSPPLPASPITVLLSGLPEWCSGVVESRGWRSCLLFLLERKGLREPWPGGATGAFRCF